LDERRIDAARLCELVHVGKDDALLLRPEIVVIDRYVHMAASPSGLYGAIAATPLRETCTVERGFDTRYRVPARASVRLQRQSAGHPRLRVRWLCLHHIACWRG
jgi:hypothetical protein